MTYKLLLLPGDGIGVECVNEVEKIIKFLNENSDINFELEKDYIGGSAYDNYGTPLAEKTLKLANDADATLLGAVGGNKWNDVAYDKRPEQGLLDIRKGMKLFANLRPAMVFDTLVSASTLKEDVVKGLDILIVRELTGGVYFGEPRGIFELANGQKRGVNTQAYESYEIIRIADVAFDLATKRDGRVCSVEKSNVMESGMLWKEEVIKRHAEKWSNLELSHMYADNCAMQLVRNPKQFDVIVTDNLFGDLLSDCAAMLTGSLGMLPSASMGAKNEQGKLPALYEPVHGSAPDIAGQNIANPLATILSFAMMLRYSFAEITLATKLESAVTDVLNTFRTKDIFVPGLTEVGTSQMGDAVIESLKNKLS